MKYRNKHWRNTTSPTWDNSRYVGDVNEFTLDGIVIDNFFFGVATVGKDGHESMVVFPNKIMMLGNYLPILIFLAVTTAMGSVFIILGKLLGPSRPDAEKNSPYECGFEAFEDSRMKFDVRYYLVAILFIIFDLEIAFLFPWAIVLDEIGTFGLVSMAIFLGVLVIGFIYEWKKGALEWE